MSPQRLVAGLVVLFVVVGIAVLALRAGGGGIGLGPEASPTMTRSAEASAEPSPDASLQASASARPSAPTGAEAQAVLEEIEEQVIAIRGLEAADVGPAEIITREELGAELQELFDEEYPPEERERDNLSLRALGLLDADQDVAELQLELLGDQVLGFYDDIEKRMVVVSDAGLDVEARITYAHEYTHALQDAAFGLDTLETDADGEDDRGLARTALIEGDATVTMLAWALAHLTPEELMEIGSGAVVPDTTGIPAWMVNQLQFPYNEGSLWAGALTGDPLDPDFAAIDEAFGDPPDSTEQIIDIAKWRDREVPVSVQMPDLAAALGSGWSEVDTTPIGEASIRIMLEYFGATREDAAAAASGWGGDRALIVTGPDGAFAVAWRLAWDSQADAAEFTDAYRAILRTLPFPATVIPVNGGEVLVAHAVTEELLRRTVDAADG